MKAFIPLREQPEKAMQGRGYAAQACAPILRLPLRVSTSHAARLTT